MPNGRTSFFYIFSVTLAKYTSIENIEASKEEAKKSKIKNKLAPHIVYCYIVLLNNKTIKYLCIILVTK